MLESLVDAGRARERERALCASELVVFIGANNPWELAGPFFYSQVRSPLCPQQGRTTEGPAQRLSCPALLRLPGKSIQRAWLLEATLGYRMELGRLSPSTKSLCVFEHRARKPQSCLERALGLTLDTEL